MTGNDQLRAQLKTMRESLRAFEDPVVEDVPGLRLMHETLRERERHIAEQILSNETVSLDLTIRGGAVGGEAVPASVVVILLAALRDAARVAGRAIVADWDVIPGDDEVAAAVEPHLADSEADDGDVIIHLTRPPGPLRAQLADPASGAPLAELAFAAVLQTLQRHTADTVLDVDGVAVALRPLAELLVSLPVTLELSTDPYVVEPSRVRVDRVGAQRLLAADSAR